MSKRRHERTQSTGGTGALPPLAERLHPLLLPVAVALLIATHLIPSEAVAREGTHAVLCMAWCALLLAWGTVTAFLPDPRLRFSWPDAALLVLIGLHTLSGIIPHEGAVTRNALNVTWLWISYGIVTILLRQLLTTAVQVRALLAVMVALAVCLAAHAYYQYFVSMPRMQDEFHANPEKVLREQRIPLDSDSPVRQHFIDRLEAREPLATFALTNSLAGFLAPWFVLAAGLALMVWQTREQRPLSMTVRLVIVALAVAAFCFGCLLLTKSRTALLAVLLGGILVALFGRVGGWRLDWRIPAAVGVVLVLLGLGAVGVGGLDAKVLSEAPKSLLYRLEYWRSTAAMIGDFPLFGCGPGNFQDYYTRYKLPQASEIIADPHNVFLEVWATAGTLALLALLAWMAALVLAAGRPPAGDQHKSPFKANEQAAGSEARRVYVGAAVGIALGFGLAFLTVYPLWTTANGGHIGILLIGLPLAGVILWLLQPWVLAGPLAAPLPAISMVTLLVNLLAAGAASFPGVISSALVLAACSMAAAKGREGGWSLSRAYLPALIVAPLAIGMACFWSEYSPVLRHQVQMHEAELLLEPARLRPVLVEKAIAALEAAAQADPASSQSWEELARLHFQQWLAGNRDARQKFVEAADEWQRRRPASHRQYAQRGAWFLQAYRHAGRPEDLQAAQQAYEEAVERYPASALNHAQLAWVHHLAGNAEQAQQEAALAIELDARNPHAEFKLRRNRLVDPVPDKDQPGGWRIERQEPAEQSLQLLRKGLVAVP
jgi:tetratricopeptide (TPR) repeat protein